MSDASDGVDEMAIVTDRPAAEELGGPRIGLGGARLVLVGELPADASMVAGAALAFSDHRPAVLVMDLRDRTFMLAPHLRRRERRIVLIGELDAATAPMLAGALRFALHDEPALVMVDVRRVASIDAWSAGAIAVTSERVGAWGGSLVVRGPRRTVRRVFETCGLGELLVPGERGTGSTPRFPDGSARHGEVPGRPAVEPDHATAQAHAASRRPDGPCTRRASRSDVRAPVRVMPPR